MNLGAIWGELDKIDRLMIDYMFNKTNLSSHDPSTFNKLIFLDLEDVQFELLANESFCKDGIFFDNDDEGEGYTTSSRFDYIPIDNELKRTRRMLRLIKEVS